jgi:hypothetical protein
MNPKLLKMGDKNCSFLFSSEGANSKILTGVFKKSSLDFVGKSGFSLLAIYQKGNFGIRNEYNSRCKQKEIFRELTSTLLGPPFL